jgi:DMSO/TMAO reductase YedYZ molybdopterin-dependent catalytic subunit
MLRAEDGYYEEFPLAALEPGLLAFGMNGRTLPSEHGAPVRALVPGHWGEVNVKWLTEIDVLEEEATGYWEKRGWHGTGPVNTVAKLSTKGVRQDDTAYVAGHAYAGTRGIDRVEVSIDGGSTWQAATLSEPLPGDDVWRQWRYGFQPEGSHEVVVRAIDGTGTLQPRERSDAFPSGATGWVRTTFEP